MNASADSTIVSVVRSQNVRYMTAVSMTILTYDWLLLFDDEVKLLWRPGPIFPKIFYLAIRYPTFVDISLTVVNYFTPDASPSFCVAKEVPSLYFTATGIATTERKSLAQALSYVLLTSSDTSGINLEDIWFCGNIYPVIKFSQSFVFLDQTLPGVPGCILAGGDPIIFVSYASLLAVEIVFVILTLIKGFRTLRSSQSAVVKTLYRDGILFFLCIASTSLASVLTLLLAPIEYADLVAAIVRVLHTVLCCRVVIHLRRAAHRDTEGTEPTVQPQRGSRSSGVRSLQFWRLSQPSGQTASHSATLDTIEMTNMTSSADSTSSVSRGVQEDMSAV
ncbi:hypothetical protein NM688_g289 [Phlebia brevispora]|uniref:Uncharacterized protein n=1 Tax=Phlebia brevispora TaxID=194682 RepID=A0ACC1TEM0_9APHY|nr:hypothetical protein NM688_g289 [Phlebia brevispora]